MFVAGFSMSCNRGAIPLDTSKSAMSEGNNREENCGWYEGFLNNHLFVNGKEYRTRDVPKGKVYLTERVKFRTGILSVADLVFLMTKRDLKEVEWNSDGEYSLEEGFVIGESETKHAFVLIGSDGFCIKRNNKRTRFWCAIRNDTSKVKNDDWFLLHINVMKTLDA